MPFCKQTNKSVHDISELVKFNITFNSRQSGKSTRNILKILESMTPEQYALLNKMVLNALESRILHGTKESRQAIMRAQIRANLRGTDYNSVFMDDINNNQ